MRELSLREIQLKSLEILMDIDKVCRENSIEYFVIFGTLIGAIRHNVFIPWDDDIDIGMARADYNKFLLYYKEKGKFRIVNSQSESKCPYMISRISDDRFKLETEYGSKYDIGIFVDVYPYDGLGNNKSSIHKMVKLSSRYSKGLARSIENNPVIAVNNLHNGIKKWLLLVSYILPKIKGVNYYREKLNNIIKKYSYEDSKYVGCAIWALVEKECIEKKWIEEIIDVEFEGNLVRAPKFYDEILRFNFGDYMQFPPVEERVGHHFYKIYEK